MLLLRSLKRSTHVIDEHANGLELLDVGLEAGRPPRLEVELDGKAQVAGELPKIAQLRLTKEWQAVRVVGMHARRNHRQLLDQVAHLLLDSLAASKEQARPLELALSDLQAMFKVSV